MISFWVPGTPRPQGSKRGFVNKHTGKVAMVESAGAPLKDWRGDVKRFAVDAQGDTPPLTGPVKVFLTFYLSKPKSAPKTRITYPDKRPDVDKLGRSVLDALTGVCFLDDSQVTGLLLRKVWAETSGPGVVVTVFGGELEAWSIEAALRQGP